MSVTDSYDAVQIIRLKRDGHEVPAAAIGWLVDGFTAGRVTDAQMSAFAMAVVLRGCSRDEVHALTAAMTASGRRMNLSALGRPTVDKHSTGGIGDKITLPLAPLIASFGIAVPQLSGRGLGYTGGTLDKLESIPGWRADLSPAELTAQLRTVGAVVCAPGPDLAPADRRLYALRDETGTVESIPLIAASIMSKKIAEGADALVLDVKFGSGALIPPPEQARELARVMVELGADAGLETTVLLTDMDTPLGRTIGNANEVREAEEVLAGGGPADVIELTLALGREMAAAAGRPDLDLDAALSDGRAMDTWRAMIRAQGGDPDAPLPSARETHTITATRDGYLVRTDALAFGIAAWRLGAGRTRQTDPVAHAAGIDLHAVRGEWVTAGTPLFTLSSDDETRIPRALAALDGGWEIADAAPVVSPRVRERITA